LFRGLLVCRGHAFMRVTGDRSTSSQDRLVNRQTPLLELAVNAQYSFHKKLVPFCAFREPTICWFRGPQLFTPYVPESGVFLYGLLLIFFVLNINMCSLEEHTSVYIFYVNLFENLCVCVGVFCICARFVCMRVCISRELLMRTYIYQVGVCTLYSMMCVCGRLGLLYMCPLCLFACVHQP